MTEKPNFFKLGVFILIAMALIVGGIILFGSGAFGEKKIYFETYFEDSVHGLGPGSLVHISGVVVGVVEEVAFVLRVYDLPLDEAEFSEFGQHIRVTMSALEEKLPSPETEKREQRLAALVERGFRLRLASNLITGQAYLEGTILDPERFPVLEVPWTPQYAYVPSAPGAFRTMQDSVDKIINKLEQIELSVVVDNLNVVLETLNQAILDADLKSLSGKTQKLMVDADQAVIDANIKQLSTKVSGLLDELRQSNQDLQKLIKNPDSEKELDNIPILIDNFNQTLSRLNELITSETPQAKEIIKNIRQLSENLNYLSEHLKDNPSELLLSTPPPKKEK